MFTACGRRVTKRTRRPKGASPTLRRELEMALLPSTLSRAGPLSSDILDLHVTAHDPAVCVVTVVGEIDALTAPGLVAVLTAQLIGSPSVVVNVDGVRFLSSAGLHTLLETNELATG